MIDVYFSTLKSCSIIAGIYLELGHSTLLPFFFIRYEWGGDMMLKCVEIGDRATKQSCK